MLPPGVTTLDFSKAAFDCGPRGTPRLCARSSSTEFIDGSLGIRALHQPASHSEAEIRRHLLALDSIQCQPGDHHLPDVADPAIEVDPCIHDLGESRIGFTLDPVAAWQRNH